MTTHLLLIGGLLLGLTPPTAAARDTQRPLVVSFRVTPEVTEPGKAPTLEVTVRNPTNVPLTLMETRFPQCFVYFYLQLKLKTPKGDAGAPSSCAILSWPGVPIQITAGGEFKKQLPLDKLFPHDPWQAGEYVLDVAWDPHELKAYMGGEYALAASSQSLSGERFTLAKELTKLRIKRGETVTLPDGAKLTFTAHSHKMEAAGSPPGPLIVRGAFTVPGKTTAAEFSAHVYPATNRIMRLAGGYTFELVGHEYDSFMELRYFGALKSTDSAN